MNAPSVDIDSIVIGAGVVGLAVARALAQSGREVFVLEAVAVGMKAQEQGLAGLSLSKDQLQRQARQMIHSAHALTETMMREGLIAAHPA